MYNCITLHILYYTNTNFNLFSIVYCILQRISLIKLFRYARLHKLYLISFIVSFEWYILIMVGDGVANEIQFQQCAWKTSIETYI